MTIVKYFFDKQKDIQNIWKAANLKNKLADFSRNIKPELLYLSLNKGLSESEADIEKFNKQIYDSEIIQTFPGLLDDAWDTIEYSYFLRLQRITGKQFIRKQVLGFVTTIQKCPYNPEEG